MGGNEGVTATRSGLGDACTGHVTPASPTVNGDQYPQATLKGTSVKANETVLRREDQRLQIPFLAPQDSIS